MAFPGDYTLYDELIVASGKIAATTSGYPILIDFSQLTATFWANVKSDGGDLRITEEDGTTQLPLHVVDIDTGAETGYGFFKPTTLSTTLSERIFALHYNGTDTMPAQSSTYGKDNVWTPLRVRCSLDEAANTSAGGYADDSVGTNCAFTGVSMTVDVAGKIGSGRAADFDGSADYLDNDNPTFIKPAGSDWLAQFWFKRASTPTSGETIFSAINTAGTDWIRVYFNDTSGTIALGMDDGASSPIVTSTGTYDDDVWHLVCLKHDATANTCILVIDGVLEATSASTLTGTIDSDDETLLGALWGSGGANQTPKRLFFNGSIDEFWMSYASLLPGSALPSTNQLLTIFSNQDDQATWWDSITAKPAGSGRIMASMAADGGLAAAGGLAGRGGGIAG